MQAQARSIQINRTAYHADLFQIEFCTVATRGSAGLSPLARSYLSFLLALVRLGYSQIKAPLAVIAAAQFRAFGYTKSRRSAQRAIDELSKHGFIHRPALRINYDSKLSVININIDRFSFWTKNPKKPTLSSKNLHAPNLPTDKLTSNPKNLQIVDPMVLSSNSLKSKINAKNKKAKTNFDSWQDPRFYTVRLVLAVDRPAQAALIESRARAFFAKNSTGHKWTAQNWQTLTYSEREYIARHELIPEIQSNALQAAPNALQTLIDCLVHRPEPTPEPAPLAPESPIKEPSEPTPIILSDFELSILTAAKKRTNNY